jgi:diadenylate cyclase
MASLIFPLSDHIAKLAEPRAITEMALMFLVVYAALKLMRVARPVMLALGIAVFSALYWIAVVEGTSAFGVVFRAGLLFIAVAVIVLFQPEIRRALIGLGNRFRSPFSRRHRGQFGQSIYDEVVLAATTLASTKTGALIVIERSNELKRFVDVGVELDARLSYDLLVAIFNSASPLHDGAVVMRGDRIAAACCFLPLSLNPTLSKSLGTRHRAALGVTEDSDAVAIVVSEETGLMSFVMAGQIKRALDATRLRAAIFQAIEGSAPEKSPRKIAHAEESEAKESASA